MENYSGQFTIDSGRVSIDSRRRVNEDRHLCTSRHRSRASRHMANDKVDLHRTRIRFSLPPTLPPLHPHPPPPPPPRPIPPRRRFALLIEPRPFG
jgi:hypothetical protein